MWHILWQARQQILEHPSYNRILDDDPFASVATLDDLPRLTTSFNGIEVPLSKELIRWFHHFFPVPDETASPPSKRARPAA